MDYNLYKQIGTELYGKDNERVLSEKERSILEQLVQHFEIVTPNSFKNKRTAELIYGPRNNYNPHVFSQGQRGAYL